MKNETEFWSLLSYVKVSKNRTAVIKTLENTPKMPRDIAKETQIDRNYVSNLLAQLKEKELVKCLNPQDSKGRFYIITEDKGKLVLEYL